MPEQIWRGSPSPTSIISTSSLSESGCCWQLTIWPTRKSMAEMSLGGPVGTSASDPASASPSAFVATLATRCCSGGLRRAASARPTAPKAAPASKGAQMVAARDACACEAASVAPDCRPSVGPAARRCRCAMDAVSAPAPAETNAEAPLADAAVRQRNSDRPAVVVATAADMTTKLLSFVKLAIAPLMIQATSPGASKIQT
mmetsp:Transcript_9640/g.24884  ORF Transcript_9640/g.24884 Transcript_9640/m.24884 type:complete len:201 (+) Transcript_9640:492-1094(+)